MTRKLSQSARRLVRAGKNLARSVSKSVCDVQHLLFAELHREHNLLAGALPPDRLAPFFDRMKFLAERGPATDNGLPVELSRTVKQVISRLRAMETTAEVSLAELTIALISQPGPTIPLLDEHGVTPAAIARQAQAAAETAEQSEPSTPTNGVPQAKEVSADWLTDLTALAGAGKLPRAFGREPFVAETERILLKMGTGHVVYIGEAGVGKTAIAEEFAHRLNSGDVAENLRGCRLLRIDIGPLMAGTKFRGDFEKRLKELLEEAKFTNKIILFIDEIHLLFGLGRTDGALDAANLLKPALARGEIRVIGATTLDEWKILEKDPALQRRLQPVIVPAMSRDETLHLLHEVAPVYAKHHGATFTAAALAEIAQVAPQVFPDRKSPGREIDILDEVGALISMKGRQAESRTVGIDEVRCLAALRSGIPADRMGQTLPEKLERMLGVLRERVVGQPVALEELESWLLLALARIEADAGPLAVLWLQGPPGVGKSLTAKLISDEVLGPDRMIRIDLAQYRDESSRARLVGSDRGLIGYEEGGTLTEPVRRKPSSLVLLENVDQAHPVITDLVGQILQRGEIVDNHGRPISFRGALVVVTSTPDRNQNSVTSAWETSAGTPVPFQPLGDVGLRELLDRFLQTGYCRWLRTADPTLSTITAEVEHTSTHHVFRAYSQLEHHATLRIDRAALDALLVHAATAGEVFSLAQSELNFALGRVYLQEGRLPAEINIRALRA